MEIEEKVCPFCKEQVRITTTPVPVHGGQATLPDPGQVVCLDFGEACRNHPDCAITGLPRMVMAVRLARSGLRPESEWETITGRCNGCGAVTEMEILDDDYAFCTRCGTTNRRVTIRLDDDTFIAMAGTE